MNNMNTLTNCIEALTALRESGIHPDALISVSKGFEGGYLRVDEPNGNRITFAFSDFRIED